MARDRNTFAKRQRETGKKQKAAEKRARRQRKKEQAQGLFRPTAANTLPTGSSAEGSNDS
jgi:hypothetical protein